MCWFWIIKCIEHDHTLAKEMVLCDSGKNGDMCVLSHEIANAMTNTSTYPTRKTILKTTTDQTSLVLENIVKTEKRIVPCHMFRYISQGLKASNVYYAYTVMSKNPGSSLDVKEGKGTITIPDSSEDESTSEEESMTYTPSRTCAASTVSTVTPDDSVSRAGARIRHPATSSIEGTSTSTVESWVRAVSVCYGHDVKNTVQSSKVKSVSSRPSSKAHVRPSAGSSRGWRTRSSSSSVRG